MCLMHTDLPVPEGPRIIEIWLSGRPRLRPFSTRLRPNALTTSMNSTASSEPCSRLVPVCHWYSSASAWEPRAWVISPVPRFAVAGAAALSSAGCSCSTVVCSCGSCCSTPRLCSQSCGSSGRSPSPSLRSSLTAPSPTYWCSWIRAPEDLRSDHPDQMDHHRVEHHRLRRGRADSHRPAAGVVAVIAPDQHDHGGHRHALDQAVKEVGRVLEHPEDQEEASGRDLADLLHHRQVAREEPGADG